MLLKAVILSLIAYMIMYVIENIQPKLDFSYLKLIPVLIIILCIVYVLIRYAGRKIKEFSENQASMIFKGI